MTALQDGLYALERRALCDDAGAAAVLAEVGRLQDGNARLLSTADRTSNEARKAEAEVKRLKAELVVLLAASKDAITEIRERSFARKPLSRAIDTAETALSPTTTPASKGGAQ